MILKSGAPGSCTENTRLLASGRRYEAKMKKSMDLIKRYAADDSGATALEYGLIAGLIGVGILVGIGKFATNQDSAWNGLADKVTNTIY